MTQVAGQQEGAMGGRQEKIGGNRSITSNQAIANMPRFIHVIPSTGEALVPDAANLMVG